MADAKRKGSGMAGADAPGPNWADALSDAYRLDTPGEEWKTLLEICDEFSLVETSARRKLMTLIREGSAERKQFRIKSLSFGSGSRVVWHYRLLKQ